MSLAFPTWADGAYAFPVEDLEAGFGRGDAVTLIKLGPAEPRDAEHSLQLVFRGELRSGTHRAVSERGDGSAAFTASLTGTALLVRAGQIVVERVDDSAVVGTVDLEVTSLLNPELTHLVGRFHARRERFYDGQLERQQVIRERMKRQR